MDRVTVVRRIAFDGIMLALLCVVGMFSIPFGANVKVSLQLLMVFLICLNSRSFAEPLIITACYLALGLFLPIYAGFSSWISATFGFVIGFVLASPVIYFMNKIPINQYLRMTLACLGGLLIVYISGSLWMMFYLQWGLAETLAVSIVPYLPFDAAKIVLAVLITRMLPEVVRR